ncbi:MAG: hypothetical protein ABL989_07730 [Gammaproteobacteria bacterium]
MRRLITILTLCLSTFTAQAAPVTFEYSGFVNLVTGTDLSLLPYPVSVGDPFTLSYRFDPDVPDAIPGLVWGANSMSQVSVTFPTGTFSWAPVPRSFDTQIVYKNDVGPSTCPDISNYFHATGASHELPQDASPNPAYFANMTLESCDSEPAAAPWPPGLEGVDKYLGAPETAEFNLQNDFTFQVNRRDLFGNATSATVLGDFFAGGQVVPIPPAAWLFGSALGVMGWMRRAIGGHTAAYRP